MLVAYKVIPGYLVEQSCTGQAHTLFDNQSFDVYMQLPMQMRILVRILLRILVVRILARILVIVRILVLDRKDPCDAKIVALFDKIPLKKKTRFND